MQKVTEDRTVEVSHEKLKEESENFGFAKSSAIFSILSDSLYSEPIKAIIRELACNAYDAQKRADNENKPFIVKLPTRIKPTFYVRDFGCSMTPDEIKEIYSMYGKSDKNKTNDEIGYFGIGGKSPLAYTDAFVLTTFIDGTKRVYTISLDEEELPTYTKRSETDTDEPNGTKVEFPVKKKDFKSFKQKADKALRFFEPTPEIKGQSLDVEKEEAFLEGKGWEYAPSRNGTIAVMGNVPYPIDKSQIDNYLGDGYVLYFDIGQLLMSADRESLRYKEETVKAIENKFEKIEQSLSDQIKEKLNNAESFEQAVATYLTLTKNKGLNTPDDYIPTWDGYDLPNKSSFSISLFNKNNDKVRLYKNGDYDNGLTSDRYYNSESFTLKIVSKHSTGWNNPTKYEAADRHYEVIYADENYAKYKKVKNLSKQNPNKTYILVTTDSNEKFQKFLNKAGPIIEDVKLVSNLEKPEKNTSTQSGPSTKAKADHLRLDNRVSTNKQCWSVVDDLPDKCYWVYLYRYKCNLRKRKHGSNYLEPKRFLDKFNQINNRLASIFNAKLELPIIGVKHRVVPKAEKRTGWTRLDKGMKQIYDYFINEFSTTFGNYYKAEQKYLTFARRVYQNKERIDGKGFEKIADKFDKMFQGYDYQQVRDLASLSGKMNRFYHLNFNADYDESKLNYKELENLVKNTIDKYPFINMGYNSCKYSLSDQRNIDTINAYYHYKLKEDNLKEQLKNDNS